MTAIEGKTAGVTRWLLIEQIKLYRQRSGLNHADMAEVDLGSTARWNRLENHKPGVRLRDGDIHTMKRVFKLSDVEADELLDMLGRAKKEEVTSLRVEPTFREYLAFERHAETVDAIGSVVHGLLQTPEYTAAIAALDGAAPEDIPGIVALRKERQRLSLGRARIRFVLNEEAVLRQVGSEECMAELRAHLLKLATSGLAVIKVHPMSKGAHSVFLSGVTMLRFTAGGVSRGIVYTENDLGGSHSDNPEVFARVRKKFAGVIEQAISIEEYMA